MSLYGGASGAANAAPAPASSLTGADAVMSDAAWGDAMAQDDPNGAEQRPMVAARGIVIGIVVSIPLWAVVAVVAYLLI